MVQRGGEGPQARPRCTKCNSPPINNQCTDHRIAGLRAHSIVLVSCKPANLVFDQVCSQAFDKFVTVCDTLSTFFVENLVANRSRFAGSCAC